MASSFPSSKAAFPRARDKLNTKSSWPFKSIDPQAIEVSPTGVSATPTCLNSANNGDGCYGKPRDS